MRQPRAWRVERALNVTTHVDGQIATGVHNGYSVFVDAIK
jgi:hypothetical protein